MSAQHDGSLIPKMWTFQERFSMQEIVRLVWRAFYMPNHLDHRHHAQEVGAGLIVDFSSDEAKRREALRYIQDFIALLPDRRTRVARSKPFWKILLVLFEPDAAVLLYFQMLQVTDENAALQHVKNNELIQLTPERIEHLYLLALESHFTSGIGR